MVLELGFEARQVVVRHTLTERDEVAACLHSRVHVGAELGPTPQDLTHVLAEALAETAEFAIESLDALVQLVGQCRLSGRALLRAGRFRASEPFGQCVVRRAGRR